MSNHDSGGESGGRGHLDTVEPGAGCVEIWEHLSEQRGESRAGCCDDD